MQLFVNTGRAVFKRFKIRREMKENVLITDLKRLLNVYIDDFSGRSSTHISRRLDLSRNIQVVHACAEGKSAKQFCGSMMRVFVLVTWSPGKFKFFQIKTNLKVKCEVKWSAPCACAVLFFSFSIFSSNFIRFTSNTLELVFSWNFINTLYNEWHKWFNARFSFSSFSAK